MFILDSKFKTVQRTMNTVLSALAESGGISSVIIITMAVLVSQIVKAKFYISILSKVFLVDSTPTIESNEISAKVKDSH